MLAQQGNILEHLKPYTLPILIFALVGGLIVLWLYRQGSVKQQKSQNYVSDCLSEIGDIHNKLVNLEKRIHSHLQASQKYSGATKEKVDAANQELKNHLVTHKQLQKMIRDMESQLQTGQGSENDLKELESKMHQVAGQADEVEFGVSDIDEFYQQLYDLENEIQEHLSDSQKSVSQLKSQVTDYSALMVLEEQLAKAAIREVNADPIDAYRMLVELEPQITSLQMNMALSPESEEETAATGQYFAELFESEVKIEFPPIEESETEEESKAEEPPPVTEAVSVTPVTEDESSDQMKFELADSWLRDFEQPESESESETVTWPESTASVEGSDTTEDEKAHILANAQTLFSVGQPWLGAVAEETPLEKIAQAESITEAVAEPVETYTVEAVEEQVEAVEEQAEAVEEQAEAVEEQAEAVEEQAEAVEEQAEVVEEQAEAVEEQPEPEMPSTPVEPVSATEAIPHLAMFLPPRTLSGVVRKKKVIYLKKDKEQIALLSIKHALKSPHHAMLSAVANPFDLSTDTEFDERLDPLEQKLLQIQRELIPTLVERVKNHLSLTNENKQELLATLQSDLDQALLLVGQSRKLKKNPRRLMVNLERINRLIQDIKAKEDQLLAFTTAMIPEKTEQLEEETMVGS